MFSKFFPIFHSSSLVAKATNARLLVGTAGAALAMLGMTAGAASASNIIYQDSFVGSSTLGTLNGAAPTVDNGSSSTWTASSAWADSGYTNTATGRWNASLAFTPVSGQIYTLSAGLDMTGLTAQAPSDNWLALGFMNTQNTNTAFDANYQDPSQPAAADPWVSNSLNANGGTSFTGPGTVGASAFANTSGVNNYEIVLNTGVSAWTYQIFQTNSSVTNKLVGSGTFGTNPTITAVGLENGLGIGQVSNFELTSSPVPEPATLGLFAIGGASGVLMLLKRRRCAA